MQKKILYPITLLFFAMLIVGCSTTPNSPASNLIETQQESNTINNTKSEMMQKDDVMMKEDTNSFVTEGQYIAYTPESFQEASDKKRVLFFHAAWCPTCKQADQEFNAQISSLPSNVVLFKTDYDTNTELKKKFGITYQHTFVLTDENGDEVKKWNGGSIDRLLREVQ